MAKIFPGRYAASIDGPFVVFVIGMRISIYVNMPRWGLAVAGEQVPAVGRMSEARTRMGAK